MATEGWTVQTQQAAACTPCPDKHDLRRRRLRRLKTCCQTFWSFLFSHIGLSAVVVAYSIMGGFLFQWLEAPNESRVRADMNQRRNATVLEIVQQAVDLANDSDIFHIKVMTLITKYEKDLIFAVNEHGYDGEKVDDLKWTFAGALLFAVTVTTTIGYGHVAPKTPQGRVITILYALIGIPLTFLCLANIGDFLANCFRWFYAKICCGVCCILWKNPKKKHSKHMNISRKRPTENHTGSDKDKKKNKKLKKRKTIGKLKPEKKSESHESLHTDTSLLDQMETEINTKDHEEETFYSTLDIFQDYKESNLSLAETKIHLKDDDVVISVQDLFQAKETDITNFNGEQNAELEQLPKPVPETVSEDIDAGEGRLKRRWSSRRKRNRRKDKRWKSDTAAMFEDLNQVPGLQRPKRTQLERYAASNEVMELDVEIKRVHQGKEKVRVPITVCLLLIFLYIMAGAFLFAKWEGWDHLTGSYFCFVTLSTIGFGDIVPGMTLGVAGDNEDNSQEKLVACAMYLAMGLSVLAMCFNLMQEEVKEKFRWLAKKIGIMSSEEDGT